MTDDSEIKQFDSSAYDVVVSNEIFLMDTRKLARIKKYIVANPEKIVLATGDANQLEPVEPATNAHEDLEACSNSCVDLIFPDQLFLRDNKRLRTAEDKQKLRDFKADIFNESIPIEETVRKYFPVVQGSETDFNIPITM